eukprot:6200670-Pleurochrysis_carterae.AAC.2
MLRGVRCRSSSAHRQLSGPYDQTTAVFAFFHEHALCIPSDGQSPTSLALDLLNARMRGFVPKPLIHAQGSNDTARAAKTADKVPVGGPSLSVTKLRPLLVCADVQIVSRRPQRVYEALFASRAVDAPCLDMCAAAHR